MDKTLFSNGEKQSLAIRYAPRNIDEIVGQDHLVGERGLIRTFLKNKTIPSMIFWGPPGTGKTSIAKIIASEASLKFISTSAITHNAKELKELIEKTYRYYGKFILFVDEIHHFNRKQQDFFLPYIEEEKIIFIGATTENPSFNLIKPLISRCHIIIFNPLEENQIEKRLKEIIEKESMKEEVPPDLIKYIVRESSGDLRRAINLLELIINIPPMERISNKIDKYLPIKLLQYDKQGDHHYQLISAFIKSLRGSDPDAAVYYLARMLESGEDPLYIARRMIIFASEDIGNADPLALLIAVAAKQAYESVGDAEGWIPLSHAAIYLATAEKSNSTYIAYKEAQKIINLTGDLPPPKEISFAANRFMKELGFGKEYSYPHNFQKHFVKFHYLPEKIKNVIFYKPSSLGRERKIKERLLKLWGSWKKYEE